MDLSCLVLKSKSTNSAIEIKGIKLKSGEKSEISISTTPQKEEIEDEVVENEKPEKKKKIVKRSSGK